MPIRASRTVVMALTASLGVSATCLNAQPRDAEATQLMASHQYREITFVNESAGDCVMSGVLTLFDHGYAIWSTSTKTNKSTTGDIWHQSIEVSDSSNRRLFGFGQWDSPRMFVGSEYNWRATGTFPAGFYGSIAGATSSASC